MLRWRQSGRLREAAPYFGYALASAAATAIVFTVHWYQTGEFFAFIHTQKFWGGEWRLPDIPFTTWGLEDNGLYDQLALFVCLLCLVWTIVHLVRGARHRCLATDRPLLLSALYCSGLALLMLFTKGGSFNSINRYVFATPFIMVLICGLNTTRMRWNAHVVIAALGVAFYSVCWHMLTSVERALNAAGLVLFALTVPALLQRRNRYTVGAVWLLSAGLLYLQAQLWFRFMTGEWVG